MGCRRGYDAYFASQTTAFSAKAQRPVWEVALTQNVMEATHDSRIQSERDFHNARYGSGEDSRKHLDKFYLAIGHGDRAFHARVKAAATGRTVLEYGCADGTSACLEMRTPAHAKAYHGIDIAEESIALARAKAERAGFANASFEAMNAESMSFPNGSFDLIYGHGILHHLDLERSFSELNRTLKPGGRAMFMEPLGHNPVLNWYRNRTPDLRTADEHPLIKDDFELARRYFADVEVDFYGLTTPLSVLFGRTPLAAPVLSMLNGIDRLLFRSKAIALQAWYAMLVMTKAA